ncbi:MAG: hypothetical protein QG597_1336 [Actinomycetota bacterium]|nr:hypothetical protein [Actinomycetota bacterium]
MSTPEGSDQSGSLRAGTRDRDATAQQLQEAYADGRLTSQEHDQRLSACFQAVTMGDLAALTADLPKPGGPTGSDTPAPSYAAATQGGNPPQESRGQFDANNPKTLAAIWSGWAVLSLFMIFIWAFSGMGSFWPIWVIVPVGFGAAMATITRKTGGGGR